MNYTRYKLDTGEITGAGMCSAADVEFQALDGEGVLEGLASDATQYVVNGEFADRPLVTDLAQFDVAQGQGFTVSIPTGTICSSGGEAHTVTGDELLIEGGAVGEYDLTMHPPFPYQVWFGRVVVS